MIKKLNDVFFGICIIAIIMVELYLVQRMPKDWITIIGMTIILIITGYLFIEAVKEKRKKFLEISAKEKKLETILIANYLLTKKIMTLTDGHITKGEDSLLLDQKYKEDNPLKNNDKKLDLFTEQEIIEIKSFLEKNIVLLEEIKGSDMKKQKNKENAQVIPLYNDPNKELTRDEIASLFESFGQ